MQVGGFLNQSYLHVKNPYENSTSQKTPNQEEERQTQNQQNTSSSEELTSAEKSLVNKLQASDSQVRRHEAAHIAAGGNLIKSGANFTYQKGPDNKLYAIGGEVSIDTGKEAKPEETINKMQRVRAAALAPSDPSSTDYQVASTATMLEMQARLELSVLKREELTQKSSSTYANNEEDTAEFSLYA